MTLPLGINWLQAAIVWVGFGMLTAGAMVWFRKVSPDRMSKVLAVSIVVWPGAIVALVLAMLARLVWWIFDPDHGPIAMVATLIGAASRPEIPPPPVGKEAK